MLPTVSPTQTSAWKSLQQHKDNDIKSIKMKELFAKDADRFKKLSHTFGDIVIDFSKNIITDNFKSIVGALGKKATLLLGGLLAEDEADILQLTSAFHLQHIKTYHRDKWIFMKFMSNVS